ncbi:MAG: hypothetical protein A3I14_13505 [Candidatus Rokubacteria bacterium RIFCSPLOWO2_02_FULL_73_56]|nr:MAG: hypothetical protein A3I14_13505 [Candidatus Rokubacteria bacterium RIFCSPLOWO2_02_FULL_73_56]
MPKAVTAVSLAPSSPGTAAAGSAPSPCSVVNATLPAALTLKAIWRYSSTPAASPGAGDAPATAPAAAWRPASVAVGALKSG